ncbi:MAG: DEAD/DEAH box helicase [Verrucomicrobiaceae bacterium]|nr:DEAD/DEAH box helicase [Verrucomicrobiaceae bacterium]
MQSLGDIVRIPDAWQTEAYEHLCAGRDVIIDAPTGAGKTYVFEMLIERGFTGKVVYTVPTRALANDKYSEWKSRGWRVGISTGDYCVDTNAPIVVATLETQKNAIFTGNTPDLLVIDEYQLISDTIRGFNYELSIALAPKHTQLLLISGSVENTSDIKKWFKNIGRNCEVVSHPTRAVPLEEIVSTALPDTDTKGLYSMWAKLVHKIIVADMAPVLIFAPHRAEAEAIARKLATELSCPDFLNLPKQVASSAGRELANMMRKRIAFHHSGLSAYQRSAIVEKYARNGKLNVVVATTGLGAGVNFSMRSAIVVSREYETVSGTQVLRQDELLQMYGRAGRRGKDKLGFAISLPSKPRLSEAKKAILKRVDAIDSAASIRVMANAVDNKEDCVEALKRFYSRLFTFEKIDIGFDDISKLSRKNKRQSLTTDKSVKIEVFNSHGMWERRRPKGISVLNETLYFDKDKVWVPFLSSANALMSLKIGRVVKYNEKFVILLDIAFTKDGTLCFTKVARKIIARITSVNKSYRCYFAGDKLTLKNIRRNFSKFVEAYFAGALVEEFQEKNGKVSAVIDLANAKVNVVVDSYGAKLYKPPEREVLVVGENDFEKLSGLSTSSGTGSSLALTWYKFGLVDSNFKPTMRGRIFSFFNGGEGYAVAAGIEDDSYAIEDLLFDLANLRAGGRFHLSNTQRGVSSRLADVCRLTFFSASVKGALKGGVPLTYGEGASEIIRELVNGAQLSGFENDLILRGDVERAYLEWKSMLRHITHLPHLENERWLSLQALASKYV